MSTPRYHSANSSSALDAYPVRIMLGLVMSLSLLLALVRLPVQSPVNRVGWTAHPPAERIVLEEVTTDRSEDDATKGREQAQPPPVTDLRSLQSEPQTASAPPETLDQQPTQPDSGGSETFEKVESIAELGITTRTPQIVGGKGSFYLHINYPQKALEQGVEGRLELEFTVEPDGSVTDLVVVKSLHPLCDSAAVKGVRSVQFVPAKHNGKPIPIRLRLPVEFQLRAPPSAALSKGTAP